MRPRLPPILAFSQSNAGASATARITDQIRIEAKGAISRKLKVMNRASTPRVTNTSTDSVTTRWRVGSAGVDMTRPLLD